MSIYLEAAEYVQREAERAQSLAKVGESLKSVGSLEQAANEAQHKLGNAQMALIAVEASIAAAQSQADGIIAKAKEDAEDVKKRAEANAKLRSEAAKEIEAEAAAYLRDSKAAGDALRATADQYGKDIVAAAKAEAEKLAPMIAEGEAKLLDLHNATVEAQRQLDAINADIAALKAKF